MHFWFTTNKIIQIDALWNIDHYIIDSMMIIYFFKSSYHLKRFQSYLNSGYINMSSTIETEQSNKKSFLDVNVIYQQGKYTTSAYRKPTFSGVFSHSDSFLSIIYKTCICFLDMLYRGKSFKSCHGKSFTDNQYFQSKCFRKMVFQKTSLIVGLSCS